MQTKIGTILVALALVAAPAVLQPAFAEEPASTAMALSGDHTDAHTVAEGRALYAHHCSHCHGFNMVNPGTVAYDLRQFPHDQKSRFVSSVTNGKNGRMPQWGDVLSREEIDKSGPMWKPEAASEGEHAVDTGGRFHLFCPRGRRRRRERQRGHAQGVPE